MNWMRANVQASDCGQRPRQHGLAQARHVFEQHVALAQQRHQHPVDHLGACRRSPGSTLARTRSASSRTRATAAASAGAAAGGRSAAVRCNSSPAVFEAWRGAGGRRVHCAPAWPSGSPPFVFSCGAGAYLRFGTRCLATPSAGGAPPAPRRTRLDLFVAPAQGLKMRGDFGQAPPVRATALPTAGSG